MEKEINMTNILKLAAEFPEITISIKLADLIEANKALVQDVVNNYKESIIKAHETEKAENAISSKKAMKILHVSQPTLWRWAHAGYLVPFKVGSKNRYRMSDIEKIMNEKGGDYEIQ